VENIIKKIDIFLLFPLQNKKKYLPLHRLKERQFDMMAR
jgi:hypothetical protein